MKKKLGLCKFKVYDKILGSFWISFGSVMGMIGILFLIIFFVLEYEFLFMFFFCIIEEIECLFEVGKNFWEVVRKEFLVEYGGELKDRVLGERYGKVVVKGCGLDIEVVVFI